MSTVHYSNEVTRKVATKFLESKKAIEIFEGLPTRLGPSSKAQETYRLLKDILFADMDDRDEGRVAWDEVALTCMETITPAEAPDDDGDYDEEDEDDA